MRARTLQTGSRDVSGSVERLERICTGYLAVFDGRDHETFPRRSRRFSGLPQIPILEDVTSP